ncbi:nicotinate-nucleotide adenylyltransferase [Corynebacterium variabile]|uniref:nicotinate-nucleotide adenylyltransferase n=1 Tax=Corynebacterium variabile TaxID=1727 RepID=UPI003CC0FF8D
MVIQRSRPIGSVDVNTPTTGQGRTGRPRRIGVMGGTFDPIHNGHLVAASEVAALFELDLVIFVPTGQPWQKKDRYVSEAEHRYLMTVIATASNPRFTVSRVDIDRPGATYTVDTLKDIQQHHPDAELFFITGADALDRIVTWRDWEEVFHLAHCVGVTRPGYDLADAGEQLRAQVDADRLSLVNIPAMAISSTDIRERASEQWPVWYLVPDGVVQYIAKTGMYRNTEEVHPSYLEGNPDAEPDVDWGTHRFPPGWF